MKTFAVLTLKQNFMGDNLRKVVAFLCKSNQLRMLLIDFIDPTKSI